MAEATESDARRESLIDSTLGGYVLIFLVLFLAPTVAAVFIVTANFRPTLSEDFLFLYFGITSAIAIGVWSTVVLAESYRDKRVLYFPTMLMLSAAILGLAAAISGTRFAPYFVDISVSFLLVGLLFMMVHASIHVWAAERQAASMNSPSAAKSQPTSTTTLSKSLMSDTPAERGRAPQR